MRTLRLWGTQRTQWPTAFVSLQLFPELRTVAAWLPPQQGSALEWGSLESPGTIAHWNRMHRHPTLAEERVLFAKPPVGWPRWNGRAPETFGSYPGKNACVSANKSCGCRKTGFAWCLCKQHPVFTGVGNSLVRGARGPGSYSNRCLVLGVTFGLLGDDSPKPMLFLPVIPNWKVFAKHLRKEMFHPSPSMAEQVTW